MSPLSKRIRKLVSQLRTLDRDRRVFGAGNPRSGHHYRFNRVLSIRKLMDFERSSGITLPKDYRDFLTEVGNGGAGPYYGVHSLNVSGDEAYLRTPFPWTDARSLDDDDEFDTLFDMSGCIALSDMGCTGSVRLVVNGPAFGQVWNSSDYSIAPSTRSFAEWYLDWAEGSLRLVKNEIAVDRLRVGLHLDSARELFGPNMSNYSHSNLDPQAMYQVSFDDLCTTFDIGFGNVIVRINRARGLFLKY